MALSADREEEIRAMLARFQAEGKYPRLTVVVHDLLDELDRLRGTPKREREDDRLARFEEWLAARGEYLVPGQRAAARLLLDRTGPEIAARGRRRGGRTWLLVRVVAYREEERVPC